MSVLDKARELLESRLSEIDAEKARLERAMAELGGKRSNTGSTSAKRTRKSSGKKRGKRGERPRQAASLIEQHPGISASEIAEKLGVQANYLYRVLNDLEKSGQVRKDGRQYFPTAEAGQTGDGETSEPSGNDGESTEGGTAPSDDEGASEPQAQPDAGPEDTPGNAEEGGSEEGEPQGEPVGAGV